MTSTRERQRAAARARLEREMAERAAKARKRRQTQAIIGAGVALVVVVAGTIWLVSALGDDEKKTAGPTPTASASAAPTMCVWNPVPKAQLPKGVPNVGTPPTGKEPRTGTQTLTMTTNQGVITVKVDVSKAPCTAASFTHLAGKKFFDGSKCHRLVTEGLKVLQCGDPSVKGKGYPKTEGTGGPPYRFAEENLPVGQRPTYPEGVMAMAKSQQPGSTGSQFFLVYGDTELDPSYTIVGRVEQGLDVVKKIAKGGHDNAFAQQAGGGHPKLEVVITSLRMSPVS